MRGRLTRSVEDPAAVLAERKPLTGCDGETNEECAEPGFQKPANFLRETVLFKHGRFV